MADGTSKPISEVEVGEEVLATDPETGQSAARPVAALIRHGGQHTMVDVGLADGTVIEATDGHPFWDVTTGAFTDAIDLQPGELVLTLDGRSLQVTAVRAHAEDLTAYNLEIDGIHTYYAGETPVLVHNSCGPDVDTLSELARNLDPADAGGQLSAAGRAYAKASEVFGKTSGGPTAINDAGQYVLDEILTNPGSVRSVMNTGHFQGGTLIRSPEGVGAVFSPEGVIQYFGWK
jgi:hypothetical protein